MAPWGKIPVRPPLDTARYSTGATSTQGSEIDGRGPGPANNVGLKVPVKWAPDDAVPNAQTAFVPKRLRGAGNHVRDPLADSPTTVELLQESPGYRYLEPEIRDVLLGVICGTHYISDSGRHYLGERITSDSFRNGSPEEQAHELREFLANAKDWLPFNVDRVKPDASGRPFKLSKPTEISNYPFRSGPADALRYAVKFRDQVIEVYVFKHSQDPGLRQTYETIDGIAQALSTLPERHLSLLQRVLVDPLPNPQDAHLPEEYKNSFSVVNAGNNTIEFHPWWKSVKQPLSATMHHEFAHLVDDRFGTSASKEWIDAMKNDLIPASAYAAVHTREDFAETYALYHLIKDTPYFETMKAIYPRRFKIIERLSRSEKL